MNATVSRYNLQQEVDTKEIEIHVLKLGNIAIVTNPYELFLGYGNRLRARSMTEKTILIQCAVVLQDIRPPKSEKRNHYSAYVSSSTTGHEGGDLLVRKTLTEINSVWD